MGVYVVELQPPGKLLQEKELELAIHPATNVLDEGMKRLIVRRILLNTGHGMHERAPFSASHRDPWSENQVVLLNSLPVKAACINHHPKVRVTGKRQILKRGIPSAKRKTVHNIDGIGVRNSDVYVSTWDQLSPRYRREHRQAQECHNHGSGFRHENDSSLANMPAANST